jgi:fumarate reductase subunit C
MHRWWLRDPYFVRYMAREMTSLLVAVYALVLLVGLVRLGQGEAAYMGWLQALRSPWSVAVHSVVLATFVYHTWSWFRIMPKTMPTLFLGDRRVPQQAITIAGLAVAACACLVLLALAWGAAS